MASTFGELCLLKHLKRHLYLDVPPPSSTEPIHPNRLDYIGYRRCAIQLPGFGVYDNSRLKIFKTFPKQKRLILDTWLSLTISQTSRG